MAERLRAIMKVNPRKQRSKKQQEIEKDPTRTRSGKPKRKQRSRSDHAQLLKDDDLQLVAVSAGALAGCGPV